MPSLLSVNVGRPRDVPTGRRTVRTAGWKAPVGGRVEIAQLRLLRVMAHAVLVDRTMLPDLRVIPGLPDVWHELIRELAA